MMLTFLGGKTERIIGEAKEKLQASTEGEIMMITFLGRNTARIIEEAKEKLQASTEKVLVVSRDNDFLEAPEGFETIEVSSFVVEANVEYIIIGNGGTTPQLVGVLKALVEAKASFKVIDLQRDGMSRLW